MNSHQPLTSLRINEPAGIDSARQVVVGGVPLRRGVLPRGGWFVLTDADGNKQIVEGTPAAYWPDGSIKWLHLCGAIDLEGVEKKKFQLWPLESAPNFSGLATKKDGAAVVVEGGAIAVRITANAGGLLQVARGKSLDGTALLSGPGLTAALRLTDPEGKSRPELSWVIDPSGPTLVSQSANRVVARLAGTFVEAERTVAELILFVEVLRESAQLGLQPVLIFMGDPDRDLIASLTMTVHTAFAGNDTSYALANERGRGYRDVMQPVPPDPNYPHKPNKPQPPHTGGPRFPNARIVQSGASFYHSDKRTGAGSSWVKILEGERSKGWCHLTNGEGGITAAMRYFWQEYPRSLSLNAHEGTLCFGLVPPECPPLDFRRYSPSIWGAPVYETGQGPFSAQTHGATGTAKASELMLHFHEAGEEDAALQGALFAHPARFMVEPDEFIATHVVGRVLSHAAPGYEAIEESLTELADFIVAERGVRGWYGLLNFGDVMLAYYRDKDRWAYDDGGFAWINTEQLPDLGLWLSALRKGRADWLEAAIEMTRHNRDVDTYHRGELRGLGTRHGVNHYSDTDKEWRVTMPLVRRLHYYTTADPWTLEVIRETVKVFQSYDRTTRVAPSMMSAMIGLMVKHELSNAPADETAIRNLLDVMARVVRPDGHFSQQMHADLATGLGEPIDDDKTLMGSYFFLLSFGGQHGLCEALETYGHKPLSDAIVRFARLVAKKDWPADALHPPIPGTALAALAVAHRVTGEPQFKQAIVDAIGGGTEFKFEEVGGDGPLDEPRHKVLAGMARRNKIMCSMAIALHLLPYGLAALSTHETAKEVR